MAIFRILPLRSVRTALTVHVLFDGSHFDIARTRDGLLAESPCLHGL